MKLIALSFFLLNCLLHKSSVYAAEMTLKCIYEKQGAAQAVELSLEEKQGQKAA